MDSERLGQSGARPSIPEVVDRFRAYHDEHPTWGSLHIVLDDGNVDAHHVEFCVRWAEREGDIEGVVLGKILQRMSRTQRLKLGKVA